MGGGGAAHVDLRGEPGGVFGRQQAVERRLERARVGGPALAVGESELFRLDQHMHQIGRQQPHGGEIELLDDLQFFEQHKARRIGRRFEHPIAAVIDRDRLPAFRP